MAYARLGALSQAIKHELQTDLKIHDAAILPTFINLPQVTAAEYSAVRPMLYMAPGSMSTSSSPASQKPFVRKFMCWGQYTASYAIRRIHLAYAMQCH